MAALTEVQQFVTSCGRFSDGFLDYSKEASTEGRKISTLEEITEIRMPQQYSMPFPEVNLVQQQPSDKDKERHLRGLWHELVQHLRDLRYLTKIVFKVYHKKDNKKRILADPALLQPVLAAVKKYLSEEKEWDELEKILPIGRSIDLFWLSKHLSTVVDRIGLHTCWDGSILIPEKYTVGEKTIFGRALAFRLRTLSSTDYKFSEDSYYYNGQDNEILNKFFSRGAPLQGFKGSANDRQIPPEFWKALGNIDSLVFSYVDNIDEKRDLTMLYQLAPEKGESQILIQDLKKKDFKIMKADWLEYDKKTAREIVKTAKRQKKRLDEGLDLRLLQIKLWQAGYYTGAIDGNWEKYSHRALMAFLLDEPLTAAVVNSRKEQREKDTKSKESALIRKWRIEKKALKGGEVKRQLRKEKTDAVKKLQAAKKEANTKDDAALKEARRIRSLLTVVNKDNQVYAANFKAIFIYLGVDLKARAESTNILEEAALINELPAAAGIGQDIFDEKILQEEGLGKMYPDNFEKPKRRVSFFRKVGGFIVGGLAKIGKWLAEAAEKALDFVLGPVFSLVKKLLRPIRAAIHRFFQGFKYLTHFVFGRPIVTETAPATATAPARIFATKFQHDFDAMNFVPAGYEADEPRRHATHLQRMQEDMAYFIDGVIWVIKAIGKLTNPGGWVWLGWQIMKCIAGGVPVLATLWPKRALA